MCLLLENTPTFHFMAFKELHGELPCFSYHLKGSCTEINCKGVHQAGKFSKRAKEQLRQFIRTSACPFGVACTPTRVPGCAYLHVCPQLDRCNDLDCRFRAPAFEDKGHKPNPASAIYAETLGEEYTTLLAQRTAFFSTKLNSVNDLDSSDF